MSEISIYANIIKPIDELGNEIFFELAQPDLRDFILSLDEKVGNVDFTISLIKKLTNNLIKFYETYDINVIDDKFKNEYKILNSIQDQLDSFRK